MGCSEYEKDVQVELHVKQFRGNHSRQSQLKKITSNLRFLLN